jgi:hypothetical protein
LVRVFDLLDELPQTIRWIHGAAVLVERRGEAVNANLHRCLSEVDRSVPDEGADPEQHHRDEGIHLGILN